jgi:hypothetical protein
MASSVERMTTINRWTIVLAEIRQAELVGWDDAGGGWLDSHVAGAAGKRYAGDLMSRTIQVAYRLWS